MNTIDPEHDLIVVVDVTHLEQTEENKQLEFTIEKCHDENLVKLV